MKRYTCRLLLTTVLVLLLNFFPGKVNAQIDPGDDPDAPIDGGLSLLLAAGVGYGIKKRRDSRKNIVP